MHFVAWRVRDTREMVSDNFFYAFLILNIEIEFLKKEDLTNESGLGIFLKHEVPKHKMIGENCDFGPK